VWTAADETDQRMALAVALLEPPERPVGVVQREELGRRTAGT
jgi:hypothetical protein